MFARSSGAGIKMRNKRNRNNFIKVNGFIKKRKELRDFCGFDVVPDGSKFTRFKQDFLSDLQSMFDHLVDLTEPICQNLDPALAFMTIFDTSWH